MKNRVPVTVELTIHIGEEVESFSVDTHILEGANPYTPLASLTRSVVVQAEDWTSQQEHKHALKVMNKTKVDTTPPHSSDRDQVNVHGPECGCDYCIHNM